MKKLLLLFPLIFVFAFVSNAQTSTSKGVVSVAPKKFQHLAESGRFPIIDIRTAKEFDEGHIKGAINIDFYKKTFFINMEKYMNKPFLIYSRSGNRTARAMKKLNEIGYKEGYELKGGIIAWKRLGFNLLK